MNTAGLAACGVLHWVKLDTASLPRLGGLMRTEEPAGEMATHNKARKSAERLEAGSISS
jgi:hypothetical protein